MREKVILVCEECFSRNYITEKNKLNTTTRVVVKKYCPKCNKHTIVKFKMVTKNNVIKTSQ